MNITVCIEEYFMDYRVAPFGEIWQNGMFNVPSDIVDRYIRLASEYQLKALLFIFRNNGRSSSSQIAKALGQTVGDIDDLLEFWIDEGVLFIDGQAATQDAPMSDKNDNDKRDKPVLICNIDDVEYKITSKQFDDIAKIILYQNILHYDDTYINPEIRKNMEEQDRLKMSNIVPPNTERRIAIITAHCGVLKSDQLNMTMRSHQALFDEVCGEVEFTTIRPVAIYGGKGKELEHWIYKDKKNKFDGYSTSVEQFNKSMGGDGTVLSAGNTARGDALLSRMNDMK